MGKNMISSEDVKKPSSLSLSSWKSIIKRVFKENQRDNTTLLSAGATFYALLSIIPILSSAIIIYSLALDIQTMTDHLNVILSFIPDKYSESIRAQLFSMLLIEEKKLSFGLLGTLFISLWSASKASKGIMRALNIIYEEKEKRSFLKVNLIALFITIVGLFSGMTSLILVLGMPVMIKFLNLPEFIENAIGVSSYGVLLITFTLFLAFVYKVAPSRRSPQWSWVSVGSIFTTTAWLIFSGLFSWYISNFGSYDKTYGPLGAIVALMMWMYLTFNILLFGAQLNAEQERQTDYDSTIGKERPKGKRGAEMADFNKGHKVSNPQG